MWLDGSFDRLTVSNVRIRNQNADGINFHKQVTNSTVTQSYFRNTGDDSIAMWNDPIQGTPDRRFYLLVNEETLVVADMLLALFIARLTLTKTAWFL